MRIICKIIWVCFETFGKTTEYLICGFFNKICDMMEWIERKAKEE